MRIDAHHHFWKYDAAEFDWIGEDMRAIRRDYQPADLRAEIDAAGIDGVVSVQSRQIVAETARLLELADSHDFIKAVVGWVPLVADSVAADLERFAANPKLKGVRHVLQGEPDAYMRRDDFNAGIRALSRFGLAYDILIVERQLSTATAFVDIHPSQTFVLDHIAKPGIRAGSFAAWRQGILEIAKRENVFCKLSGMVTEADFATWTEAQLRPYVDAVLEAFGPARVMFGSDWPVCLVACGYARWVETVARLTAPLSPDERADVFGGTARRAYRL